MDEVRNENVLSLLCRHPKPPPSPNPHLKPPPHPTHRSLSLPIPLLVVPSTHTLSITYITGAAYMNKTIHAHHYHSQNQNQPNQYKQPESIKTETRRQNPPSSLYRIATKNRSITVGSLGDRPSRSFHLRSARYASGRRTRLTLPLRSHHRFPPPPPSPI
ncbi:hypothetical protein RJT34_03384 [Clitoria ternatea]|uniref:Uncharacterized protein n=1 Tax=Clitoria ternatea TaxID=43366 RepID=A0AAN9Q2H2_CLITE